MANQAQEQEQDDIEAVPIEFVGRVCVIWTNRSSPNKLVYDRWYGCHNAAGGPITWRLVDLDTVDKYNYDENDYVRRVQTTRREVQSDFVRVYHSETGMSKKFPIVWIGGLKPRESDVLERLAADLHRQFKRYEPDFDSIATALAAPLDMALPHMIGRVYYTEPKWHNVGYIYAKAHGRGYEVLDKAMKSDAHHHSVRAVEKQETVKEQYPGRGDVEEISFCYFPGMLSDKLSTAKLWDLLGQIRQVNEHARAELVGGR